MAAAAFDYRSVLKPKSFLTLFNPGLEIKRDFNGNTYTFPADGTVSIEEAISYAFDKDGNRTSKVIPVEEVVSHFIGDDGVSGALGPVGVRILSGDPEQDEAIKAEARDVYKQRLYINDLAIKGAHMASVRVAKESGNPAPSPDRYIIEAFKRIEAYEAGGNASLPFSCPECAMPFLTSPEVSTHQEAQHKQGVPVAVQSGGDETLKAALAQSAAQVATLTELVAKMISAQATVAEAKRKPGRPKKDKEASA